MDTSTIVWIIVVVIIVIAVIILISYFGRRRKLEADRNRAGEMRETARNDELGAREGEAKAARADADAKQAAVDAERLRREASDRQEEAQTVRARSNEQSREANQIDPDVRTDRAGNPVEDRVVSHRANGDTASDQNVDQTIDHDRTDRRHE